MISFNEGLFQNKGVPMLQKPSPEQQRQAKIQQMQVRKELIHKQQQEEEARKQRHLGAQYVAPRQINMPFRPKPSM